MVHNWVLYIAAFASAFGQVSKLVRGNITGKIKEQFAKMSKEDNKEVNSEE